MNRRTALRPEHRAPSLEQLVNPKTIAILLGVATGVIAVQLLQLPTKYALALLAGTTIGGVFLAIRSQRNTVFFLVALFALSLPVNLDVNFLYRWHAGGAYAFTISVSMVGAISLLLYLRFLAAEDSPGLQLDPRLIWPTALYMVCGVLSLYNAEYPELVGLELFRLSTLLMILLVTMNLRDVKYVEVFTGFLAIGVLFQAALGIAQYRTGETMGLSLFGEEELVQQYLGYMAYRATGTVGHPNFFANYLELVLPLMFAMLLVTDGVWRKTLYFLALGGGLAALVTTLSRGAWVATAISLPAVFLAVQWGRLVRIRTAIQLFALGAVVLAALYAAHPTLERRLTHSDYGSAAMRRPLNEAAFSLVEQFPVFGVGMNNHSEVFGRYDTTGYTRELGGEKHPVHNLYLLVWSEVGTVGMFAFLSIFVTTFYVAQRLFFRVPRWSRGLLVGTTAGLAAHLLHGLIDQGFKASLLLSILVYSFIGLVGATAIAQRRKVESLAAPYERS